jgi:hypothetical protein
MAGSTRPNAVLDANRLNDVTGSLRQAYPGLLERMNHGQGLAPINGVWRHVGALDVHQPEVDEAFCRISAKIALAEYYARNGRPARARTRIKTTWTHRFNPEAQRSVDLIMRLFPEGRSLHAGTWGTDDSFYIRAGEREGDLYVASFFHEAVVLAAQVVGTDLARMSMDWMKVMSPTAAHGISQIMFGGSPVQGAP